MNTLPIGTVARRAGCSVPTVRYYEAIGLLPAATRTPAGQRRYGEAALQRLGLIRRCRDFGFTVEQVRELVGLVATPAAPCQAVRDAAAAHLAEVRRRLAELATLEASLANIVARCDGDCARGPVADCSLVDALAPTPRPAGCGCR